MNIDYNIKRNFFNIKKEKISNNIDKKDSSKKIEKIDNKEVKENKNYPDTNLPQYLTKKNKEQKKEFKYRLLAISSQKNNSRCIIKNKITENTYILYEGQKFDNFVLKKVEKDYIVVNWDGRKINLKISKIMSGNNDL